MELLDYMLDIAELSALEAQAFRYTRNNICMWPIQFDMIWHRDPENLSLRLHYCELLKQYRNTPWKKKEQHVRNQVNVIEESIESNHLFENFENSKQTTQRVIGLYGKTVLSSLIGSITKHKQQNHIMIKYKS